MIRVVVERGGAEQSTYLLPDGTTLVGRGHRCGVRLQERDISKEHLRLRISGEQVAATNIGRFGSKLDEGDIVEDCPIQIGQKLYLGKHTVLRIESVGSDDSAIVTDGPKTAVPRRSDVDASVRTNVDGGVTAARGTNLTLSIRVGDRTGDDSTGGSLRGEPATAGESSGKVEKTRPWAEEWLGDQQGESRSRSSVDGTQIQVTRGAGPGELEALRTRLQRGARVRVAVFAICGLVVLVGFIALHHLMTRDTGKVVEWPEDAAGNALESEDSRPAGVKGGDYRIVYPKVVGLKRISDVPWEVELAMGQKGDVPMRLRITDERRPEYAKLNAATAASAWMLEVTAADDGSRWTIDPPLEQDLFFSCPGEGNGIPFQCIFYIVTRKTAWCGAAYVFCHGERRIVAQVEFPREQRSRMGDFLYYYYIRPTPAFVRSHWQAPRVAPTESATHLLQSAREDLRASGPAVWDATRATLYGAMQKAVAEGESKCGTDAMELLLLLRDRQRLWYNNQMNLRYAAQLRGDKRTLERVRSQTQAVFSSPDDERYFECRKW